MARASLPKPETCESLLAYHRLPRMIIDPEASDGANNFRTALTTFETSGSARAVDLKLEFFQGHLF